jgi:hypothetical protein
VSLPHLVRFPDLFKPEFHELRQTKQTSGRGSEHSAQRERARVRPIWGGFRVGKCHRIALGWWSLDHQRERDRGEIGGEIGDQMRARGDRVGSGRWVVGR